MIESLYQIDFITATGTRRLVSAGDLLDAELNPAISQKSAQYSAIGAPWVESVAEGGASVSLSFTVLAEHASHAALRGWCLSKAATFPSGETGIVRIAITAGETWDIHDALISSSSPVPAPEGCFRTLTSYALTGGEMLPYGTITLYAGIPWQFINQLWEDLTTHWEEL